jgi:DNA-binding NarL/FixJ family response regulator
LRDTLAVLVVDDITRSRKGLRALLDTCQELHTVGEATDGQQALELVGVLRPDVVVMDARMPGMDGVTATRVIKQQWPEVRVIVLTMYESLRADAVCAGADAFLIKGCAPDELLDATLGRNRG